MSTSNRKSSLAASTPWDAVRPTRIGVLDVDCFAGTLEQAATLVTERACATRGGYACLANVHVLVSAQHDPQLRQVLGDAWEVFPDGAPVAWLQRRSSSDSAQRVGGPDLMSRVCSQGVARELRHFFLGSTNAVLARLLENLERAHPGIRVAGSYSPSRDEIEQDQKTVTARIQLCRPDVVWCAFGAPRQELWMARNVTELPRTLLVGVGAAFDFISGTKNRAPLWMQNRGLEWLHRFGSEPGRLGGRYIRTNSEFLLRSFGHIARARYSSRSNDEKQGTTPASVWFDVRATRGIDQRPPETEE